jgi:hypothetical protein
MEDEMKNQTNQSGNNCSIIFSASFMMLAAAVCDQLEKAGIPASLRDINDIYCVCVPAVYARNSRELLQAEPRRGEILFALD